MLRKDIENEQDIKVLVDTFYDKINQDELLGPVFNDFAQINWDEHLPIMYRFWSNILFGTSQYKGQPFPKHLRLPITPEHFTRWISLFYQTVDELFAGSKAEDAKIRANSIANVFQLKMGFITIKK